MNVSFKNIGQFRRVAKDLSDECKFVPELNCSIIMDSEGVTISPTVKGSKNNQKMQSKISNQKMQSNIDLLKRQVKEFDNGNITKDDFVEFCCDFAGQLQKGV